MKSMREQVNIDCPSVQSYLSILQGIINRMASNSAGSKTWCVGLVSAILVLIADKGRAEYVWISLVPITLFFFLDAYYLGMERRFRDIYNEFIGKIHREIATVNDMFIVNPGKGVGMVLKSTFRALFSISVWPFYFLLALTLVLVRAVLNGSL